MALLVRLRRALLRSSSIPKCCSFPPIPSDSSHLINLSKTLFSAASRLENPSIRPTPSKHDRRPPSTCSNRFLFRTHYSRQLGTKIPKDEIDFPKFPKPSPEEMIETFFQNLAKILASAEDAKAIEKMSDKLKESGFEMIEQLKGACMREKRSVEDVEVIEEMSDKLRKSGLETIEKLKGMLGFVSVLPGSDIDNKNNKSEDNIEKAKGESVSDCSSGSSEESIGWREWIIRFKDYIDMVQTTDTQKKSHIRFSPKDTAAYAALVEILKGIQGSPWRSYVFYREDGSEVSLPPPPNQTKPVPQPCGRPLVLRRKRPAIGLRKPITTEDFDKLERDYEDEGIKQVP